MTDPLRRRISPTRMTYEYLCTACAHAWEAEQRISEPPLDVCPACGERTARRQVSGGAGFLLKGGGWYADGYASARSTGSEAAGSSSGSGSNAGSSEAAPTTSSGSSSAAGAEGGASSSSSGAKSESAKPAAA
ncbi:MAG: zinc ribbon domain-containing protein [Polyangiaceae bacterium]|nr:zinc ribbon domain-containing protein [Polyangiaceae bacterium]